MKEAKETHLNRIQRMKKLYLQPRNTPRKVSEYLVMSVIPKFCLVVVDVNVVVAVNVG